MTSVVADPTALVGQCIAERYELEACIGRGATGATYRAKHLESQRAVIVKLFAGDVSEAAREQRQFELETSALSSLSHPNTPAILGFGVHYGQCFVAREWLEGETLAKRLERGPLEHEAVLRISRQLLAALAAAHAAGLLHRNLHPGNVFLESRAHGERVKLLDFALLPSASATRFTPPERAAGEIDTRSDVFAVGALVAAMLQQASGPNLRPLQPSAAAAAGTTEAHAGQSALASAAVVAVLSTASPGSAAAPPSAAAVVAPVAVKNRESGPGRSLPTRAADENDIGRGPVDVAEASALGAAEPAELAERAGEGEGDRRSHRFGAPLVSAFDQDAPLHTPRPKREPAPAFQPQTPLQHWIERATAREPDDRFDDAAEMLRDLVDGPPRDLFARAVRDHAAEPPPPRPEPHAQPLPPLDPDVELDAPPAAAGSVPSLGLAAPSGSAPTKKSALPPPAPVSTPAVPTLLPEASPIALHSTIEPGSTQLTAVTAFGAFAVAALVIFGTPALFGHGKQHSTIRLRATAPPAELAQTPAAAPAPAAPEPEAPPAPIPLSAIAAVPAAPAPKPQPYVAAAAPVAKPKPSKVAPPARDPWKDPVPKELQRFRASAWSGGNGDKEAIEALRVYNREHADDARGYLVTARFFLNRMWRTDGVNQYAAALERDASVRGAPEILPALLECVAQGKATEAAEALIEKTYGTGATPAIDKAIDGAKTKDAAVRLSTLNEKLLARAP